MSDKEYIEYLELRIAHGVYRMRENGKTRVLAEYILDNRGSSFTAQDVLENTTLTESKQVIDAIKNLRDSGWNIESLNQSGHKGEWIHHEKQNA